MSKYYHAGNGECFLSHQSVGKPAAYCDTNVPIGFLEGCAEGYEVFQFIDKSSHERDWFPCYWKQYDLTHPDLRRIFLTLSSEINDDESTPEGVTAEAVIKQYETYVSHSGNPIFLKENVIKAIHEYASLVSASDKKEIAQLKEDVEELVECLDLIVGSMSLERVERFELNEKAKSLIQKHEQ